MKLVFKKSCSCSATEKEIEGVGDTGLTPEEEFANRERKYSVNGVDVRRFGSSSSGGWHPSDDPYYSRKKIDSESSPVLLGNNLSPMSHKPTTGACLNQAKNLCTETQTVGVGELDQTPAQAYEVRERKQSVVNFSSDPFQQLIGKGHRASISGGTALEAANQATERRRSSAVGPHAQQHIEHVQHKSGYDGDNLAPIDSRPELPFAKDTGSFGKQYDEITTSTSSAGAHQSANGTGAAGHTGYYDAATTGHTHGDHGLAEHHDPDSVDPHEMR